MSRKFLYRDLPKKGSACITSSDHWTFLFVVVFFFFCWYALIDSTLVGAHGYSSHTTAYDFVAFGRGGLLKCCLKMPSQWPVATHMTIRVLSYGIPAAYSGKPPCLNPHSPCIESNCVDGAVTTYMRGRSDGWLLAGAFRARVCL